MQPILSILPGSGFVTYFLDVRVPKVGAILVVRDEEQLIERNVRFHQEGGFDPIIVLDHCSTDGTAAILSQLAATGAITTCSDHEPTFDHARLCNAALKRLLQQGSVDWVMPLDADEFFHTPGGVRSLVADLANNGVLYASVGWLNAVWAHSNPRLGSSPLQTKWFYQPWAERDWQHEGHFRKALCNVHQDIEVVVGGHYFRREVNPDFFANRKAPYEVPLELARIYHYEFRSSTTDLRSKWKRLSDFENDSSSQADSPWLERLNSIRQRMLRWEEHPQAEAQFWSGTPRTFWGTEVTPERWRLSPGPSEWHANFVPKYDHLKHSQTS